MTGPAATATAIVTDVNDCGVCDGCGQGRGKPHFLRCRLPLADYGRFINQRQVQGLAAYALGIFPMDAVRRSTIRAMLPRGRTYGHPTPDQRKAGKVSKNNVSRAFGSALLTFERRGWAERRGDLLVIRARNPLLGYARGQRLPEALIAGLHASLGAVAATIPEEVTVAGRAQREAELRAIKRLMEETRATGPHSGRGYVRLAGKPGMLP